MISQKEGVYYITLPLTKAEAGLLSVGDRIKLSGRIITGRDAAHKRIFDALQTGKEPFRLEGEIIYYVGPCFTPQGKIISAGPTTSVRMTKYAPALFEHGLLGIIGKGELDETVVSALKANGGVYFAAIGGAGALYAQCIKSSRILAYPELGTEAVYEFAVEDMPLIVATDSKGDSIYENTSLKQ